MHSGPAFHGSGFRNRNREKSMFVGTAGFIAEKYANSLWRSVRNSDPAGEVLRMIRGSVRDVFLQGHGQFTRSIRGICRMQNSLMGNVA